MRITKICLLFSVKRIITIRMAPLNEHDRREGRKAMEKTLTAAARVRRRLKAGRPAKIRNEKLSALQAISRLATEADKARNVMREEGLEPEDIKLALIYSTSENFGCKWLPAPSDIPAFFAHFEGLSATTEVWFLGILWYQRDAEAAARGESGDVSWVTQFVAGEAAEKVQFAVRDYFVRGGHKTQDN